MNSRKFREPRACPGQLTHLEKTQKDPRLTWGWCLGPVSAGSEGSRSAAHSPERSRPTKIGTGSLFPFYFPPPESEAPALSEIPVHLSCAAACGRPAGRSGSRRPPAPGLLRRVSFTLCRPRRFLHPQDGLAHRPLHLCKARLRLLIHPPRPSEASTGLLGPGPLAPGAGFPQVGLYSFGGSTFGFWCATPGNVASLHLLGLSVSLCAENRAEPDVQVLHSPSPWTGLKWLRACRERAMTGGRRLGLTRPPLQTGG